MPPTLPVPPLHGRLRGVCRGDGESALLRQSEREERPVVSRRGRSPEELRGESWHRRQLDCTASESRSPPPAPQTFFSASEAFSPFPSPLYPNVAPPSFIVLISFNITLNSLACVKNSSLVLLSSPSVATMAYSF